jgi:hypothetical protein
MEADLRRQKLDLVWASVFPAVFAMWGLTMLIGNDGGDGAELMALLMASGLFLAVLTASILLLFGGSGRRLLAIGRVLVALQLLCLIATTAAFVLVIVRSS